MIWSMLLTVAAPYEPHIVFISVTCLIHMCDMSHSCVNHVSSTCVTCLIHITCLIHMCDMFHSYGMPHLCVWHASFVRVTSLLHMCDIISFICVTCLIHMFVMSHSYLYMWSRARCSHTRTTHTTHTTHTHTPSENEWGILHLWMSHATSMSASCHLYARVTSLVCISHVTQGFRVGWLRLVGSIKS